MEKYFYVYYSYEEFGRGYIGKRECTCLPEEDVKYFGSYSDKSFKPTKKIILETFSSRKEAFQAEIDLHNFYEVNKNPHFANKAKAFSTGFYVCMVGEDNPMTHMKGAKSPFYGRKLTEEQIEKIKKANRGKKLSEEHKRKIGLSKIGNKNTFGKKHSEKSKQLMREKALGKKRSEETRRKISELKKGTVASEEAKRKLREARKGRRPSLGMSHTEEWKKEHSKRMTENNPFKGKQHTEETKKLISERTKGRVPPNKGKPHTEETKRKISEARRKQYQLKQLQQQSGGK